MIKFIHVVINPYNGDIEHLVEKGTPILPNQIVVSGLPQIPVAVPPEPQLPQLSYIEKQFVMDCDESLRAHDLRPALEDLDYSNPTAMPTIRSNAPQNVRDNTVGFLNYADEVVKYGARRNGQ